MFFIQSLSNMINFKKLVKRFLINQFIIAKLAQESLEQILC